MFNWFRHKAMDRELTEILDRQRMGRGNDTDIRAYLLRVLADNRNDSEKFSDEALEKAAELIEQVGPGAFYWMTDIAAQMVLLSEATLRGFATNVSVELGTAATAEEIVQKVVRLP